MWHGSSGIARCSKRQHVICMQKLSPIIYHHPAWLMCKHLGAEESGFDSFSSRSPLPRSPNHPPTPTSPYPSQSFHHTTQPTTLAPHTTSRTSQQHFASNNSYMCVSCLCIFKGRTGTAALPIPGLLLRTEATGNNYGGGEGFHLEQSSQTCHQPRQNDAQKCWLPGHDEGA